MIQVNIEDGKKRPQIKELLPTDCFVYNGGLYQLIPTVWESDRNRKNAYHFGTGSFVWLAPNTYVSECKEVTVNAVL